MSWLKTLILAIVQGLTEFLPVSSDGHLSIVNHLLNRFTPASGSISDDFFYVVALHVGTLGAIAVYYRRVALEGAAGLLLDSTDAPADRRRPAVVRAGLLAIVATLPAVPVGLFLKDSIEHLFGSTRAAGVGFLITAVELLLVARLPQGRKTLAETTWLDALLIGIGQTIAVLPGVSRSGTTIAVALALGFSRAWAVGFSLLIAVPAILGGAILELKDADLTTMTAERWLHVGVGTIVAGLIGYVAIAWLTRLVSRGRLWYFSVYLLVLGLLVLFGLREGAETRASEAVDGTFPTSHAAP